MAPSQLQKQKKNATTKRSPTGSTNATQCSIGINKNVHSGCQQPNSGHQHLAHLSEQPQVQLSLQKAPWSNEHTHDLEEEAGNQAPEHGIHGPAAIAVWESYVAQKCNHPMCPFRNTGWTHSHYVKMQDIVPLGGARGCHAFHPGVMGPPPPVSNDDEVDAGPAQAPANLSSPSSTAGPSFLHCCSFLFCQSFLYCRSFLYYRQSFFYHQPSLYHWWSHYHYQLYQCQVICINSQVSSTGLHHLGVLPPSKKARSQAGTHVYKKTSNAAKMSGATQAAKITPAAAVMGMQGTVNCLTDVF
ncbi:hypothetical protein BDR05DRAFT_996011 [Suillus weaverae]|nr:hypothetical protein BDR05DRAFT_996011 [Suillus weaverae]